MNIKSSDVNFHCFCYYVHFRQSIVALLMARGIKMGFQPISDVFLSSKYQYQTFIEAIEIDLVRPTISFSVMVWEITLSTYCLWRKPESLTEFSEALIVSSNSCTCPLKPYGRDWQYFEIIECFVFLVNMKEQITRYVQYCSRPSKWSWCGFFQKVLLVAALRIGFF